jgi:hypothetical protein
MTTLYKIKLCRVVVVEQYAEVTLELPDWLGEDARQICAEDFTKNGTVRLTWENAHVLDRCEDETRDSIPQGVIAVEPFVASSVTDMADELREHVDTRHARKETRVAGRIKGFLM